VVATAIGFAVAMLAGAGLGSAALACAGVLLVGALAAAAGWRAGRKSVV